MASSSERVVGQYPLSIATSLAIEGITGIHPDNQLGKHSLNDFKNLWVNLKTLYRNFYNAMDREFVDRVSVEDQALYFDQEMDALRKVVQTESGGVTGVKFYLPDYDKVGKRFKHAVMRTDTTPKQLAYASAMVGTINQILEHRKDEILLTSDVILEHHPEKALMMTHFPLDLSTRAFLSLALLESHTGLVKTRELWYTKYYNGKELTSMPFMASMLSIFGDNDMFRPMPIQYRRALIGLAEKYRWSFATTKDKIMYGLNTLPDKLMAEQLKLWVNS